MAALETQEAFTLKAIDPPSVQPGGGFCLGLELAWGRLRRRLLRRLRPGYVRRMAEVRQGECPNCPHDIIDARDLKFVGNVCGYWFRAEDDRFRWRDRIPLARAGLAEVVCFSLLFATLSIAFILLSLVHWSFLTPLVVIVPLWLFVLSFFRDPERVPPGDPHALLSPADGTITDVGEVEAPADFPAGRAVRIGIFLSVFNVHINRIPRTGRIVNVRYFPGEFLDARNRQCGVRNEQLWIDLEEAGSGRMVRVKQISGAIARRIVCWLKRGDHVRAGERFGMIKFGSRTELWMPAEGAYKVLVKVDDKVKGGSTVLLRFDA